MMASSPATVRAVDAVRCARMTHATVTAARALLGAFLAADTHYRASSAAYGDGGAAALDCALALFLARPEIGFVWLAFATSDESAPAVAACVVCRAISTSRGTLVAKLDDVTVREGWRNRGVGAAMLHALEGELRCERIGRIDCGCHRANIDAWRFYERHGYRPLDVERLAKLL